MRFVFISTMAGAPWGGSEELWSQAAHRLCRQGHAVSASVAWWPQLSQRVTSLAEQGVNVHMRRPASSRLLGRVWRKIARSQRRDYEWVQGQGPDLIVISHGGNGGNCEWMRLCREAGLPFAPIVQCNTEQWWPTDGQCELMRDSYLAATKVFCVSRHNAELLERQVGEPLSNAEVIWNPRNVPNADPPAWPGEGGIWKLACVARLEPSAKGQDLLLQVFSRPQWRERPVALNLYGSGPCENSLKHLADQWHLPNVRFQGHVEDIRAIWQENHLLVLPSRYEGLPLALMEAMWCGRPAVVTDIGGNAEACADGETGFVAAAPTVSLFEHAMERAWQRRHEWQRMGLAARERAERIMPKDPVEDFCRKLEMCAEGCRSPAPGQPEPLVQDRSDTLVSSHR